MFNMNPAAKEFVPAHILKKRQEDAERLGELTEQLDKVDIRSDNKVEDTENGQTTTGNSSNNVCKSSSENTKEVQEGSSRTVPTGDGDDVKHQPSNNISSKSNKNFTSSSSPTNNLQQQNNGQYTNKNINTNNHDECEYPEGLQDLVDEEDDRFLLNAGENLCEFNGEQFIIPGDDEYEPAIRVGYDFGNEEDNEDEDIRNAFEEFLGNLPGQ